MNPEKLEEITKMIRGGADYVSACAVAELTDAEMEAGMHDPVVVMAVKKAYAQCKIMLIQRIRDKGNINDIKYLLERLFPVPSGNQQQTPKRISHEPAAENDEVFDPLIESDLDVPL